MRNAIPIAEYIHSFLKRPQIGPRKNARIEKPVLTTTRSSSELFLRMQYVIIQKHLQLIYKDPLVEGISFVLLKSMDTASLRALAKPLKQDSMI